MTYQWFCSSLVDCIREKTKGEAEVRLHKIPKNNGVVLDALTILEHGQNVAPSIYIGQYYDEFLHEQSHLSIAEIAEMILREHAAHAIHQSISLDFCFDYHIIEHQIYARLVNYELNRDLLEQVPHRKFLDLAIMLYYRLPDQTMKDATIMIQNRDLEHWNVDEETLFQAALHNTFREHSFHIKPIGELIGQLEGDSLTEEETDELSMCSMFVLTNSNGFCGAISMINEELMGHIADSFGLNLILLPSSIHELILLPDSGLFSRKELNQTIQEINSKAVAPTDILSNHSYYYDRGHHAVTL